jgi:RHS repeat-associated protein
MVTPAGATYCYHYNQIGSTVALTDMNQAVVNQYAHTPFGEIANQAETIAQPFTFVGQMGVMAEPNGFYYMRARYYDPEVRRFISEDPIGFDGGDLNLYAYVGNNPMMMVDPSGHLAAPWHFIITYAASRDAGNGILTSLKNGWDAMAVDFAAGSQSTLSFAANQHAMSGYDINRYQTSLEAIQATKSFIQDSAFYNPAGARHAAQDLATPLHAGKEWKGFGFDMETVSHLLGDLFPSISTIKEAYNNTRKLF